MQKDIDKCNIMFNVLIMIRYCAIIYSSLVLCSSSATIAWGAASNLYNGSTVETFVSTSGTLAAALNASGNATSPNTVNGVPFIRSTHNNTLTGPSATIRLNGTSTSNTAFGDGEFAGSQPIFQLLQGGSFALNSVRLGGLTVGQAYQIQVITHDSRSVGADRVLGLGDGTGTSNTGTLAQAQLNVQNNNNGNGQSLIGTFTADAVIQDFNVFGSMNNGTSFSAGNGAAQINAIQIRAIPEPSTALLLGIAGGTLLLHRKRK